MNEVRVWTEKETINSLYNDYYKANKLIFNTEYQRSEVWGSDRRQQLIDSIIRKYCIGMIFFRKHGDGTYEVLDGQQRLKTIFQFMENKFSTSAELSPEVGEIKFEQIERSQ